MKALVVFDSNFGNTKQVADSMAACLGDDVRSIPVDQITPADLADIEWLIIGSPIVGWKPTEKMAKFLSELGYGRLKGVKAIAFDTRVKMFISGDAARKISQALVKAGAEIAMEPQVFYVQGKEGPLLDGELERAVELAKLIKSKNDQRR